MWEGGSIIFIGLKSKFEPRNVLTTTYFLCCLTILILKSHGNRIPLLVLVPVVARHHARVIFYYWLRVINCWLVCYASSQKILCHNSFSCEFNT